jgi:phosphoribosyl-ATP pyrophosphohydrolase
MKYNHDKFIKEWSQLQTEEEQMASLKSYMFSLPNSEFDKFLGWRFEEALNTVTSMIDNNNLSVDEKNNFIFSLETMMKKAGLVETPTRKAA